MHAYGDDGPDDAEIGRQWREDSSLEKWFPITAERLAAKERENLHLAREARTWWEAAQTYAAELERHKPLMQAVEWILEDGHMNQEHLARLRAAWEDATAEDADDKGVAGWLDEAEQRVKRRGAGKPCGECHLQPGERCDVCGASSGA